MRSTRVAAVSMNGRLGEPARILDEIDGWCGRAAAEGADLVLFPELAIHGHCTPNTAALAEAVPDGPSVTRLARLARQHGLVLSAGLSERERDLVYRMRTKENAFYGVLADQAGRAGYVDAYPRDHENQPHHPGAAMIFGPDGGLVAASQVERIRDEMVVTTLDAALLVRERAHLNYQLRTRRPELYGELLRGPHPS